MDMSFLEGLLKGDESIDEDMDCTAEDGCWVEPDGRCPHGFISPMLRLGLV